MAPKNDTVICEPGQWTRLTDGPCARATVQLQGQGGNAFSGTVAMLAATVGTVPPVDRSGALKFVGIEGLTFDLADRFPAFRGPIICLCGWTWKRTSLSAMTEALRGPRPVLSCSIDRGGASASKPPPPPAGGGVSVQVGITVGVSV